jgi:peptidoglycan/xylan/chitin deacetylase (PgdA/CDA1 family)
VGTIDFHVKFADWNATSTRMMTRFLSGNSFIQIYQNSADSIVGTIGGSSATERITLTSGSVASYEANSWHRITFSWNSNSAWAALYLDEVEVTYGTQLPFSITGSTTMTVGYQPSTNYLNGWIDELRIMDKTYRSTNYPEFRATILESSSFDTGVANPVYGNFEWDESLLNKTDIEIQTNVSSDNTNWDGWYHKALVSLTFDDEHGDIYDNAYPIMQSYGFPGVMYVTTDNVGAPSYFTLEELQTIQNVGGWEIGGHTKSHPDLTTLNDSQLDDEIGGCKTYLINNGLGHDTFAYPFGVYNQNVIHKLSDYFSTGRLIFNSFAYSDRYNTKYRLRAIDAGPVGGTVANVKSRIDDAITNKAWLGLVWHNVNNTGDGYSPRTTADFTEIMTYLASKSNDLEVVTIAQGLEKSYSDSAGDQILSANKRYMKYRAIFSTYDGANTPTLSNIRINEPAKIYKELTNTINASETYTHSVWPQTTDTELSNLNITPSTGSVDVNVDTWNVSGNYYKKWTESASTPGVTTNHTIGDLAAGSYYNVKKNGNIWNTYQANGSGQITFNYVEGFSTEITFEVEQDATAPTGGSLSINSGATSTNSRDVNLTISTDPGSGATEMMISEDSSFTGASYETYATSKSYTLSAGDGTKTVYIKFKDAASNESAGVSGSIILDTKASTPSPTPSLAEIIQTIRHYSNNPLATFSTISSHAYDLPFAFDASESFSTKGIVKYHWDFGDGATAEGIKVEHQYNSPGRYTVILTITDKAGKTATKQQTIDANPTKPTVEDISADGNDLVFKGKSYPKTTVRLEIHSDPLSVQANADDKGEWVYKVTDAKNTLGTGDHTVLASASYVLADNSELKSEPSKTYDFQVSLDDDKLKVDMEKTKTRTWQYISLGLILIIVVGFVLNRVRKKRQI